ncbi:MAG: single-stranded DNA-binding protein [Candidatus Levybacteria bacterium]|nr:single-stranded DNA-binding protein [Candidatus Levybacteria bacterium]
MARSLNRVQLIGNLTRDPELRYTPSGTAVCTFGMATNRTWTTDTGEKREEADFHRIVAWNKLAEICSQFLTKGRKAYVEGRLSTRSWTGQDGAQRSTTEVVIDDMILLDNRGSGQTIRAGGAVSTEGSAKHQDASADAPSTEQANITQPVNESASAKRKKTEPKTEESQTEEVKAEAVASDEVVPEDIPF